MAVFAEYAEYDALGLAELVRKKEVTASELLEAAIERIEAVNPKLNAVIHKLYDRAREAVAGTLPDGPFTGVPFLLKDLLAAVKDAPMQSGSRFYEGWRPEQNTELADRYLATGVVLAGKTNTPELGLLPTTEPHAFGPTHNPWSMGHTPGGSSGGSAAAVAAGMVPMASGGDGGGSIRIPASCCGLVGLKPTRGRTPAGPVDSAHWDGFAIEHVITRSVRDSAAMLDAISGPMIGDAYYLPEPSVTYLDELDKAPGKLRIAYSAKPYLPADVHPDCVAALDSTAKLLEELGHEVTEAAPELNGAEFARAYLTVLSGHLWAIVKEAERAVGRKARKRDFEPTTWLMRVMGGAFNSGQYIVAMNALRRMSRPLHAFLDEYDVLLHPTLAMPPQPHGFLKTKGVTAFAEKVAGRLPLGKVFTSDKSLDQAGEDSFRFIPFTPVFNVSGQPSISLPLHWNDAGLPIGSMFTTKFGDEATLFRLAVQLEEARPWADKRPAV